MQIKIDLAVAIPFSFWVDGYRRKLSLTISKERCEWSAELSFQHYILFSIF